MDNKTATAGTTSQDAQDAETGAMNGRKEPSVEQILLQQHLWAWIRRVPRLGEETHLLLYEDLAEACGGDEFVTGDKRRVLDQAMRRVYREGERDGLPVFLRRSKTGVKLGSHEDQARWVTGRVASHKRCLGRDVRRGVRFDGDKVPVEVRDAANAAISQGLVAEHVLSDEVGKRVLEEVQRDGSALPAKAVLKRLWSVAAEATAAAKKK